MRRGLGDHAGRLLLAGLLIGAGCCTAQAQELPRNELFMGYTYAKIQLGDDQATGASLADFGVRGWHLEFTHFFNDRIGLAVDATGHYRSDLSGQAGNVLAEATSVRHHGLLVGPRFRLLRFKRLQLSFRALVGFARADVEGRVTVGGFAGNTVSDLALDDTGPAAVFGGGVDLRLREGLVYRILQPNYYITTYGDRTQHTTRLSTGLVFQF